MMTENASPSSNRGKSSGSEHPTWPAPTRRPGMWMEWHELAFLHWPVPAATLRPHVPDSLELDTFDGDAWLGIVPFRMEGVRPFGISLPSTAGGAFPELNVRTYVTPRASSDGRKPGVWFFSLDAASWSAVRAARRWFHLPYFDARMSSRTVSGEVRYESERTHRHAPKWSFRARYRPTGRARAAEPGSLEAFLVERYCLYARDRRGRLYRGDIHHAPWPLQEGEASIEHCELSLPHTGTLLKRAPLVHYSERLDVRAWTLSRPGR